MVLEEALTGPESKGGREEGEDSWVHLWYCSLFKILFILE